MKNTGVMCMVTVCDKNRFDGPRHVDLGNYFEDDAGKRCLITSRTLARRYGHLVDVPIYVMKSNSHISANAENGLVGGTNKEVDHV